MAGAVFPIQSTDTHAVEWLALSLTAGLGTTKARRLVEHFGSVQEVFRASLTELEATGIQTVSAQSLGTGRSMELAQEELARAATAGVTLLVPDDPAYPAQLKQIYDPPLVLYVRGNAAAVSLPGIALVGTRHPTPYGMAMAERLACGHSRSSRRDCGQGKNGGSVWHGNRHHLSQREHPPRGTDSIFWRRPGI